MPWKYIKHQSIQYSEHSGMFPLCVKCFNELSPEEIDPHIEALVLSWVEDNERYGFSWDKEAPPEEVIASAKQQVRVMKAK
ncbi:MAG: hypothetical protein E3J66_07245 [Dehalococcoidia bacterium]|nr:MAG: hypothetical protein E3J66_07245 [Dehalococcoidia bacterium]